jgi:hypothetical protein
VTRDRELGLRRFSRRVGRHMRWARQQGVGRLVEEDQLNPLERIPLAVERWRWRRGHGVAPFAVPVFLVGVQRSGTNMVVRGLEHSPEFAVLNENDRRAFDRFRLRPDPVIRRLIVESGQRYLLFKPLCDSHRVAELLDTLHTPSPGRAIWAYRSMEGRVRSAVTKFGASNLQALSQTASGRGAGLWQSGGLSEKQLELLRSFDYGRMTPETGSALFWLIRNSLYFDLGLHEREDVTIASYDHFMQDPEAAMRAVCAFLGFTFRPALVAHIQPGRGRVAAPVDIDRAVLERCRELTSRLDEARRQKAASFPPGSGGGPPRS